MILEQKKIERHKKNDQKGKVKIISLLSFKVPRRWPYAKGC